MDQEPIATPLPPVVQGTLSDPVHIMAMLVFDAFHNAMRERYGYDWPHHVYTTNRHWKAFRQLGELCHACGFDPQDFVDGVMALIKYNHSIITPRDLLDEKTVAAYRKAKAQNAFLLNPAEDWVYFAKDLKAMAGSTGETEHTLLLDPMRPFPAWFRVLYPNPPDIAIVEEYGDDARKQLRQNVRMVAVLRSVAGPTIALLEQVWGRFSDEGLSA